MKIIKTYTSELRQYKEWGLGEDGELYTRFIGSGVYKYNGNQWSKYDASSNYGLCFKEMKELVEQFGHLTAFI
jgi:hypothetical protein